MPRLYFGSQGGLYYLKNGRKVYVTVEKVQIDWENFNNRLCNAILQRPPFQSLEPSYVKVGSDYCRYDDCLMKYSHDYILFENKFMNYIAKLKKNFFTKYEKVGPFDCENWEEENEDNEKIKAIMYQIQGAMCKPNEELFNMIQYLPVKDNIIVYQGVQMKDPLEEKREWNSTSIYYSTALDFVKFDADEDPVINIIVIPKGSHALCIDHYTNHNLGEVVLRNYKNCFIKVGQPFEMNIKVNNETHNEMHQFMIYIDPSRNIFEQY